ncbi:uncharacterized protein PHACADRAFT_113693 [Phanerochaete carnosa HHB-10118-sp]|uniref:Pre-rRNA-processing protein RIX1 n=1 Tax=Phanerochaete carnosa (strain HHB-10118-sp) TaxID=650164 RepID=K5X8P9_PHACS|nr:uncharacterized protein PHACADRAFT_113693 [Phanerochaete carnosa HHB-10118-sp]EKM59257.1 hypothetical protein PHACADRAFT_113693 [Phanerochaete carnosa HHB-10118-sp]
MDNHPLKILLQLHLASDTHAVLHLPYVLTTLNAEALQPSAHTQKWITRIYSLLHSKDASVRWAGLCIALRTSVNSRPVMIKCAQSWITATLPVLLKNEAPAALKATIRLLRFIFAEAVNYPEFQRQVATPNVPKLSLALVPLAEKTDNEEVQVLVLETLTHLVPLYPTLHRALLQSLSNLALRFLNGSAPRPTPTPLLHSASSLYSVLHHTSGKVGAGNQWKKSLDDTLSFAWGALQNLRTTFTNAGTQDPPISVALHLDRLKVAVTVLCDLMQTSNLRPVLLPVGSLAKLCVALLSRTTEEQVEGYIDPIIHSLEISVVPHIWEFGCCLTEGLAKCAQIHLTPHLPQILLYIARHLEGDYTPARRIRFLRAASALLGHCPALNDPTLPSRLARAVLPSLATLLASPSHAQRDDGINASGAKSRKGKKRARGYEGDEVFRKQEIVCPNREDGEVVLAALDVFQRLVQSATLNPAVQSIIGRVLLALYISLPQIPPSLFSLNLSLYGQVYEAVQRICIEIGIGTTSTMSKSLSLFIGNSFRGFKPAGVLRDIDLMLHPRVPPLIRVLPHVEILSLFRAEEGQEEKDARRDLGLISNEEAQPAASDTTPSATPIAADTVDVNATTDAAPPVIPRTAQSSLVKTPPPPALVAAAQSAMDATSTNVTSAVMPSINTQTASMVALQATEPRFSGSSTLPPSPGPLPPSSKISPFVSAPQVLSMTPAQLPTVPVTMQISEEDENEPMPAINLSSDSEEE